MTCNYKEEIDILSFFIRHFCSGMPFIFSRCAELYAHNAINEEKSNAQKGAGNIGGVMKGYPITYYCYTHLSMKSLVTSSYQINN